MTEKPSPFKLDIDEYVSSLPWGPGTEEHQDLVAGNLRTLYHMLAEEVRGVLEAAEEWAVERSPQDYGERLLMASLMKARPERYVIEECPCGEMDTCDECPTRESVMEFVRRMDIEKIKEDESRRKYVESVNRQREALEELTSEAQKRGEYDV